MSAQFQIPNKFQPLFVRGKWRNKVYKGGRGGAKSHNMARALVVMGMQSQLRIACAREIQKSIKDSVYQLLCDIIRSHDLEGFYTIQNDRILGKNGTLFVFLGLKHNVTGVKSLEGVDILWVEEAENVSDNSWEVLIPTIRKPDSEIWVSFNPKNPTDPTWRRFVENVDDKTFVETVNYLDNPFFPAVLEDERKRLQQNDPEAYKHVWLGEFDTRHTGYVYANYIMEAKNNGRITGVPYERGVQVVTAWDLGSANSTAIWFAQVVGYEPRIIDYYENNNKGIEHYAEVVRSKGYDYLMHYLPHDAKHSRLGMAGSISDQVKAMGLKNKVLGQASVESGIERARGLLSKCWFDERNCHDGIHALNNYKYEWDENRQTFKDSPLHDWSSDAADAFRYLAFAIEDISKLQTVPEITNKSQGLRTINKFQKKGSKLVSRR